MLDRLGLGMPSTHVGATEDPDLEKQLEGFQIMGIRYVEVRGAGRGPGGPQGRGPAAPTEEAVKRQAEQLNRHGEIVKRFGMKMFVHNHTNEFAFLEGSATRRPYDILLAETDPALVAMQLDIRWASVAGQNILEMFAKNPGRFELWHVKDASNISQLSSLATQSERQRAAKLVPVGEGEVSYKAIFAKSGAGRTEAFLYRAGYCRRQRFDRRGPHQLPEPAQITGVKSGAPPAWLREASFFLPLRGPGASRV